MGHAPKNTMDNRLRAILLLWGDGRLPDSIGSFNLGTFAQMVTGTDSARGRKKVRASLRRLGVKIESW